MQLIDEIVIVFFFVIEKQCYIQKLYTNSTYLTYCAWIIIN